MTDPSPEHSPLTAWFSTRAGHLALIGLGLVLVFGLGTFIGRSLGGGDDVEPVAGSHASPTTGSTSEPADSGPPSTTAVTSPVPTPAELPAGTVPKAPIAEFTCPTATVEVGSTEQLTDALAKAGPGTSIRLKNGLYQNDGEFTATAKGTADNPIYLCGDSGAVLQNEGFKSGYVLHFKNASYWRADGFTVRNGQKGVMVDTGVGIGLQNLTVESIGDEAVHLRNFTTDSVVRGLTIHGTGNRRDKFGEGVYVGTAVSNWPKITGGKPDTSNRNFVLDNRIYDTTAESVDVKEGTTGGVIAGNTFDGSGFSDADSWVDVKGNGWLIAGNVGRTSPKDGFQTHVILKGWGDANRFTDNQADVDGGKGVGFYLHEKGTNKVSCNNKEVGAADGLSNYPCSG